MAFTFNRTLLPFGVLLTLAACTSGGGIELPRFGLSPSTQYINAPEQDERNIQPMTQWWQSIDDPLLQGYVDTMLAQNLDIMQAGERMIQAEEALNIQRGGFFPSIGAEGAASRRFTPTNTGGTTAIAAQAAGAGAAGGGSSRVYTNSYSADLTTSWELDIFGKVRNSVDSARQTFNASVYDLEALKHALIAELLQRRINIAVQKNLLEFAKQNAGNRKDFYDLVKRRYDLGTQAVSASDVFLAEENYTSIEADIYQYGRTLAEESYALDVLLGQLPGTTDPSLSDFPMIVPPMNAPVCMPIDLVDRRPDLKASKLRLEARKADVDVAVADLYPSISIGGSIGVTGNSTNNLFSAEQLAGSILGNIMMRIFEGGALRANIRLQEAEARELAAAYAQDVLIAIQDVETALKAEQELNKELNATQNSVDSLEKAVKISDDRFGRGIETLQNLLDTQQRLYTRQQQYLLTQQARWNARINLYLALGGDWFGKGDLSESCGTYNKEPEE